MSPLAVELRLLLFDDGHHLLPEESVRRHELNFARWLDLALRLRLTNVLWVLLWLVHKWEPEIVNGLLKEAKSGVGLFHFGVVLELQVFCLVIKLISFLLRDLIVPFHKNQFM